MYKILQGYRMSDLLLFANLESQEYSEFVTFEKINKALGYPVYMGKFSTWLGNYDNTLFNELYNRFKDEYICIVPTDDDVENSFKKFIERCAGIISRTYKRYTYLLTAYEQNESKLMDSVKSKDTITSNNSDTSTITNSGSDESADSTTESSNMHSANSDVPQESGSLDALTDLNYASGISQQKNSITRDVTTRYTKGTQATTTSSGNNSQNISRENDMMTKMQRLNEIKNLYQDVLKDWTDEFKGLFIDEMNINPY